MNTLISSAFIFCALQSTLGEEIRAIDLEPTDAQQYIDKQDTSLRYAPKIESSVPAVRFLGNEPHNVVEDIYLANQYHGQDGLGGYLYGYSVPDIAKTEKKKAGGDLTGAYNYIAGNGQEIKVQYWDDGTGFHQIDNVPKVLPKQIDDTPEVKAAKDEHQRIWNEQAERNSRPVVDPNNPGVQQQYGQFQQPQQYQQPQGQTQQLINQYQQQKQQYPNPGQSVHYQGEQGQQTQAVGQYQRPSGGLGGQQFGQQSGLQSGGQNTGRPQSSGQYSGSQQYGQTTGGQQYGQQASGQNIGRPQTSGQYSGSQQSGSQQYGQPTGGQAQASGQYTGSQQYGQQSSGQYSASQQSYGQGQYSGEQQGKYNEEEEEKGPPKGFFYNFDYPVGIIVSKDGGPVHKRESDVKDVYDVNKANFEKQLQQGSLEGRAARSSSGYLFIKE